MSKGSSFNDGKEDDIVEKKQRFYDFLTMVLSISYGVAIFIAAIVSYASDLIVFNAYKSFVTETCNLILSSVGVVLLIWLTFDIERYIRQINKLSQYNRFGSDFKLGIEEALYFCTKRNFKENK